MRVGKVFLVGAGPGDPGLITQRGFELLKKANVVVVDALVSRELLKHARGKIISVGKRGPGAPQGSSHELAQEKINQLLVRLGKSGKTVVRLKGGDPFLFGRGSEEVEALKHAGVSVEVIPGLSSVTAVPAWAGIPITDRRYASQVTVLTGHEGKKKAALSPGVDWKSLSPKGTLVILMGVSEWPRIVPRLLARKWKRSCPVAAIQSGTTQDERVIESTLGESVKTFRKENLAAPAIIVVGEVVRLRKKRIVVTRPIEQNTRMTGQLTQSGFEPVIFPTIQVIPQKNFFHAGRYGYDTLIFLSANSARTFGRPSGALRKVSVMAVGPETKRVATQMGWKVNRVPRKYTSQGVLAALENVKGKRILIPRVQSAPKDLVKALHARGARVDQVVTYKVIPAKASAHSKEEILKGVSGVVFTSVSTVDGFFKNFSKSEARSILQRSAVFSIGPQTTKALKKHGVSHVLEAKNSTGEDVVSLVRRHFGQ